jgi:glycosyltransferase involved in cell wall biosynthesis
MSGVLLVMSWRPTEVGGVTTAVLNLRDELQRSGQVSVDLLVEEWDCRLLRSEMLDGERFYLLRVASPFHKGRVLTAALGFVGGFARTARQLSRLIEERNIATVNIHFPGLEAVFWSLLVRLGLFRGQLILSFHGADVTMAAAGKTFLEKRLWNFAIRTASALTACSAMLARELEMLFPFAVPKIFVVPNGVSAEKVLSEALATTAIEDLPPAPYIVCIAGFEAKKGLDILLRAFADVRKEQPNLTLALLCRAGPDLEALRALIQDLKLSACIYLRIDCPHNRAMAILKDAEVLVVPSRKEPFGIVVLEAAVLARPVVLTRVCGVLESLPNDPPLSIVPPDDAGALASSIALLLRNRDAAQSNAAQLRRYVLDSLTWSSAAAQLLSVYRSPIFHADPIRGRTSPP